MSKTDISEKGLEDLIVEHLTKVNGFAQGVSEDYLSDACVDWPRLLSFLEETQPLAVSALRLGQEAGRDKFLGRLSGEIAKRGVIDSKVSDPIV